MDYSNTLNLPKTEFPMKANLTQLEPHILTFWEKLSIYHLLCKERRGKEKFILHDGPPYANGLIHIGHALNKILKDIVIKYQALKGFDVPFIVGWDCHGLPVEHQLFKELKSSKHEVDVVDFRKKARKFALKFVDLQKNDFKRLGVYSDWENPYLTLNFEYEYAVMKLLGFLVKEGYIYRGRKPVNWCSACETALAEAEVEYADKKSDSIYVIFSVKGDAGNKIIGDRGLFNNGGVYFLVWTTTPWTLVSNVAVAVHPEYEYCAGGFEGKCIIFAKDLLESLESKLNTKFKILATFKGIELENLMLVHPFMERCSRVVLADFVSREEGSGCVHIAPGHGHEDFVLTKKYSLDVLMPVNDKGIFDGPMEFKGKNIKEANTTVIGMLQSKACLVKYDEVVHAYPHCWRCKNPIIFRATFQWFLNVEHKDLRKKLLEEIENVEWIPSSGKERMRGMLVSRPDWCLSRQRLWGIPIPALKCKDCGEVFLDEAVVQNVADIFKTNGSDSWFTFETTEFLPQGFSCKKCKSRDFLKEFDILDVWFESGASFFSVVKQSQDLKFPADMYLEGSDQHRGWFQVSLIPSVASQGVAPFKKILTHGFVVDGEGRKMSKSMGNVIAPQEITKKYGAEILRLWAAYSDYSEDVKISEGIIEQLVDMYRKVRNTIRFIMGNIYDFSPEHNKPEYKDLREVDKFMLSKTMVFFEEVTACYDEFSFYKVCQKIFNFCNLDLSSFYLDILKDRLYTFWADSLERRSAQFVLYRILKVLIKLIAPVLSFTAEEAYLAWKNLDDRKESIFICTFDNDYVKEYKDNSLIERWDKFIGLRNEVLKKIEKEREKGILGSSLEAKVVLKFNKDDYSFYKSYKDALREICIVSEVEIQEGQTDIIVEKKKGGKCMRCWNWGEDVGKYQEYPQICNRCVKVLKGGT